MAVPPARAPPPGERGVPAPGWLLQPRSLLTPSPDLGHTDQLSLLPRGLYVHSLLEIGQLSFLKSTRVYPSRRTTCKPSPTSGLSRSFWHVPFQGIPGARLAPPVDGAV